MTKAEFIKKKCEMRFVVLHRCMITPDLARELLKTNTNNRRLRENVVKVYADDMKNGRWNQSEDLIDVIMIGKDGVLLNGQHRLEAVIKADRPVWFWIKFDCDPKIYSYLDNGEKRRAGDVMRDVQNANNIAAIAKKVAAIETGAPLSQALNGRHKNNASVTRREIVDFAEQHLDILQEAHHAAAKIYNACSQISVSNGGTFFVLIKWLGCDDYLEEFVDDWASASSQDQAVNYAKQMLFKKAASNYEKLTQLEKFGVLMQSYMKYRNNEKMTSLRGVQGVLERTSRAIESKAQRNGVISDD